MEIEKINKVYVAAIFVEGFTGETIFVGTHTNEDGVMEPRACIEHHEWAIGSLVEMADAVVDAFKIQGKKASYRLLQFENPVEMDADIYKGLDPYTHFRPFKPKGGE